MRRTSKILVALMFLPIACGRVDADYRAAVANTLSAQADAKAFAKLFPQSEHYFSHYLGGQGPITWTSKVLLHGRYLLVMQFQATLDASRRNVVSTTTPTYVLTEITQVTVTPAGEAVVRFNGEHARFGPPEWATFEAAGGDLSSLGITPKLNQPVPNAARYSP